MFSPAGALRGAAARAVGRAFPSCPPPAAEAPRKLRRLGSSRPAVRSVSTCSSSSPGSRRPPPAGAGRPEGGSAFSPAKRRAVDRNRLPKCYLYGFSCVEAALVANRRKLYKLYVRDNLHDSDVAKRADYQRIQQAVKLLHVPVEKKPTNWLNHRSLERPNQGVLLRAGKLTATKIRALNKARKGKPYSATLVRPSGQQANIGVAAQENVWPLWLVLDRVVDPQDLGAIVRSAHFFGVDGIVVCSEDSISFSPIVSKASAGALEVMPIHEADSLEDFLSASAKQNWNIVAAGGRTGKVTGRSLPQFPTAGPLDSPTILVFGPEEGIRESVLEHCQRELPVRGAFAHHAGDLQVPGTVALTNSVAAGCLLHELTSRRDAEAEAEAKAEAEAAAERLAADDKDRTLYESVSWAQS